MKTGCAQVWSYRTNSELKPQRQKLQPQPQHGAEEPWQRASSSPFVPRPSTQRLQCWWFIGAFLLGRFRLLSYLLVSSPGPRVPAHHPPSRKAHGIVCRQSRPPSYWTERTMEGHIWHTPLHCSQPPDYSEADKMPIGSRRATRRQLVFSRRQFGPQQAHFP